MMELSRAQAVRFILSAQGLIGARRYSGKEGALAYVRRAGCIQYDPIDICGRNAELTLFSRVGGFRKSMLQSLLYRDRALVDYVDKELAIFPAEDWPCFSAYRAQSRAHGEEFEGLAPLLVCRLDVVVCRPRGDVVLQRRVGELAEGEGSRYLCRQRQMGYDEDGDDQSFHIMMAFRADTGVSPYVFYVFAGRHGSLPLRFL